MHAVDLGPLTNFSDTRYLVDLADGRCLVLFRLPRIETSIPQAPAANETRRWTYYAMNARCPHSGGPMADAQIDIEESSYIAACPWHAYDFNLETGQSSYGIKACTYPVLIRDGRVFLQLPDSEDNHVTKLCPVSEKVKFRHERKSDSTNPPPVYPSQDASLATWCDQILNTCNPEHKIELTTRLFSLFATREQSTSPMQLGSGTVHPPDEPPRQEASKVQPGSMPRSSKGGSLKSRIAMLHALANIEQWAIDLAIDICVRFADFQTDTPPDKQSQGLPRTFFYDWLRVANDEAKHFSLLRARLEELGSHFGALPVHHGLWESAKMTSHDLRARISIIALVHEARGLDVNPLTIGKFRNAGDMESVDALTIIHLDEVTHVSSGHRWLSWICEQEGTDPVQVFRSNVQKYFRGAVKGPFNTEARMQAGMDGRYYEDLGGRASTAHVIAGG